jgi:hypothetical protein
MDYNNAYNYSATAQAPSEGMMLALLGVGIAWLVFVLVVYIYFSVCLMKIAKKSDTPNSWMAWIPIVNIILMLQIARKPLWWLILFLIPLVNIIMTIVVWMAICDVLKKPNWLGILMIVPVANFIIPGYLAFSRTELGSPAVTVAQ